MSHHQYNPNQQYQPQYGYLPEEEEEPDQFDNQYQEEEYDRATLPGDQLPSSYQQPPFPSHTDLPQIRQYTPSHESEHDPFEGEPSYYQDGIPMEPLYATTSRFTVPDSPDLRAQEDEDGGDVPLLGAGAAGGRQGRSEEPALRYNIPQRQPRRFKTVKDNPLYHGNFVLEGHQLPSDLLDQLPATDEKEFTSLRYTMATCDPNTFVEERYTLRQRLGNTYKENRGRHTEVFVVLTMYNENDHLLARTLFGVFQGIEHLQKRKAETMWGDEGWKNIVICVVSDGRALVNHRSLALLAALGVYQDGIALDHGEGVETGSQRPATAHIYEHTTRMKVDKDLKVVPGNTKLLPGVQMIFCLKELNAKKINSHRWFFNAFSAVLQPNVCILLDVGTRPTEQSIYRLWKTFDDYSHVGGCCGEIVAQKERHFKNLWNPVIACQNFEYKMSNILDKPLESVFGYITVLPGAFSAYRYIALQNNQQGEGPLCEYFKGENIHKVVGGNLFTKNMYLAEDRILCWELVSKREERWTLHYQRSAQGITDVPSTVTDLINQRRRWLNGSFFASLHGILHFHYIYRSHHTFIKKFWFHVELIYQVYQTIFSWLALANFYIIFTVLLASLKATGASYDTDISTSTLTKVTSVLNPIFEYWYISMIILCFLLSLGNKPKSSPKVYLSVVISYAIITVYMLFAALYVTADVRVYTTKSKLQLFPSNLSSRMLCSEILYLLGAASYINVIQIYSFSNIHDVSWGNRPEEPTPSKLGGAKTSADGKTFETKVPLDPNKTYKESKMLLETIEVEQVKPPNKTEQEVADYATARTNVVLAWTLSNGALVVGILHTSAGQAIVTSGSAKNLNFYMIFLLYSVAGLAFIRFVGSVIYMITWTRLYHR